jgi:predicted DNA-binding transcriptional regulator YafY
MATRHRRGTALTRLFQILTLMYGGGRLTQRDFAAACGCCERQIGRDLKTLHEIGVPFDYDRQRGYFLEEHWSPLRLTLTVQEVMALLLARQSIVGRAEMPYAHSAQTAFEKIAGLLPANVRAQLREDTVAYYSAGKRNYADAPWGQLLNAIHGRDRLEMRYYTIGRDVETTRKIDPYHIVWLHGFCHLIAYCHTRTQVINFALDGIRTIQPLGETFIVPASFSLAGHLKGAAGPLLGEPTQITVRFDAEIARWARRRVWEFPHTLTDQQDGALLLSGTVRGLDDIRKELLTWGRHAEVLEPAALRDALLAEARALVALYEPTPSATIS